MKNKKTMSFVMMVVMMLQLFVAVNVFAATAPPVTSYRVTHVGSGPAPNMLTYEPIAPYQYSTVQTHSGKAYIYVVTEMMGYGYGVSRINGGATLRSDLHENILGATGYYGSTVIGFRDYWNCNRQAGTFTSTAISYNTPNIGPVSTQIYIK